MTRHSVLTDLCCHDETAGGGIYCYVSRHQTYILELFVQLSIFLVTESFDGGRVDDPLFVPQRHRYSVPKGHQMSRFKILT